MRNAHGQLSVAKALLSAGRAKLWLEQELESERDRLPLWVPVGIGVGIAGWFLLARSEYWVAFMLGGLLFPVLYLTGRFVGRTAKVIAIFSLCIALGCALIWTRTERMAAPILDRPTVATFHARILERQDMPARERIRLLLDTEGKQGLPPHVRVNVPEEKASPELRRGAVILLRARLMPPAQAPLPGAYDFARRAWYEGIGATGSLLGDVTVVYPGRQRALLSDVRGRLLGHVRSRVEGEGAGAVAGTLVTGERGAIPDADAEAMRRSGLAHLLSISGLHVSAIVAAVYLITIRLLALSPALALRVRLPLLAAGVAALAAVLYTLLTGAQVPTIRACVAALLVLAGLAMGRETFTLRMVAAGALLVLLLWPETLFGPSFQLSFAAVIAIVALHEHPAVGRLLARREESRIRRVGRFALGLFLTGLIVEVTLLPIAVFHFHKAGLYGALANIVAIPLTTFVIMPSLALGLIADLVGLGAPFWAVASAALNALLALAHWVSGLPGAVAMLPSISYTAFALVIAGGLWMCLWSQRWRWWGAAPLVAGCLLIVAAPRPDVLVMDGGRHVAIRAAGGALYMVRNRTGDFATSTLAENAGVEAMPLRLEDMPVADCSLDSCVTTIVAGDRRWTLLVTRSNIWIDALALSAACRRADIVVSDRGLPRSCRPRWLRIDRYFLDRHGGVAIDLDAPQVRTVRQMTGPHRWTRFAKD